MKQDLAKYKSMDTTQVEAALKASTYLAKWVDWVGSNSKLWIFPVYSIWKEPDVVVSRFFCILHMIF